MASSFKLTCFFLSIISTDENSLIRELGDEPAENRVKLYYCYKEKYEKDIQAVMRSELGSRSLGMAMQVRKTDDVINIECDRSIRK
jgi:hypothetical protein